MKKLHFTEKGWAIVSLFFAATLVLSSKASPQHVIAFFGLSLVAGMMTGSFLAAVIAMRRTKRVGIAMAVAKSTLGERQYREVLHSDNVQRVITRGMGLVQAYTRKDKIHPLTDIGLYVTMIATVMSCDMSWAGFFLVCLFAFSCIADFHLREQAEKMKDDFYVSGTKEAAI